MKNRQSIIKSASLTVECAVVLSLFFLACLTMMMFMDVLKTQAEKNLELSNKARGLSAAAALAADRAGSSDEDIWIDLRKTYTYRHPIPVFGLPRIRVALRARVYPWIGSENGIGSSGAGGGSADSGTVLITDHASVYHTHAECSHLDLTIIKTTTSQVGNLRNADGRRYKKCRGFPSGYTGEVYVSARGTYYYPSADYGALTRHVHIVSRSDYSGLTCCARCAALDARAGNAA